MTRAELPVLYHPSEQFDVGGSRTLRASPRDDVTIAATGVVPHEALAARGPGRPGDPGAVIDLYSIKPIDAATLQAAVRDTGGWLVTVEDHWSEGGLGDTVRSGLASS